MTDELRAELRRVIERSVRVAMAGGPSDEARYVPPLEPDQHLGLSALLRDPDMLPQALADYLLDQGHEFAQACFEKGRAKEREAIADRLYSAAHALGRATTRTSWWPRRCRAWPTTWCSTGRRPPPGLPRSEQRVPAPARPRPRSVIRPGPADGQDDPQRCRRLAHPTGTGDVPRNCTALRVRRLDGDGVRGRERRVRRATPGRTGHRPGRHDHRRRGAEGAHYSRRGGERPTGCRRVRRWWWSGCG